MLHWIKFKETGGLRDLGDGSRDFEHYWNAYFQAAADGKLDTWDYQWLFSVWFNKGLGIVPAANLVTNIGFGIGATHTTDSMDDLANLPLARLAFPLKHPDRIYRDVEFDRSMDAERLGKRRRRMVAKLLRSLNKRVNKLWERKKTLLESPTA
jgi:hypothetical protein